MTRSVPFRGELLAARWPGLLSAGLLRRSYGEDERARAGALRMHRGADELRRALDALGVRSDGL